MDLNTHTHTGVDKVTRYKWTVKDSPGELVMLSKNVLKIHPSYQRDAIAHKVADMASSWSWIACGALIIGKRGGEYWVIDGQHRVLAAKHRSDVVNLPCVVFMTEDVRQEARGFLDANAGRKPVTIIAKHKALVTAGDEIAIFVQDILEARGLVISAKAHKAGHIKSIGWCITKAAEDRETFCRVLDITAALCEPDDMAIPNRLLEAIWYLNAKCGDGLSDKRLEKRMIEKGGRVLLEAATRAAAYYAKGGARIYAEGVLNELNAGLRNKFSINELAGKA